MSGFFESMAITAYPRLRGATSLRCVKLAAVSGLSPLARGNRMTVGGGSTAFGPIPACAGQPAAHPYQCISMRAYPRLRGATTTCGTRPPAAGGLSPLARGNRGLHALGFVKAGPIPACAGQPPCRLWSGARPWAYPRLRGATGTPAAHAKAHRGLSPLARGNRCCVRRSFHSLGPIPACAGQPGAQVPPGQPHGAYPRLRGATAAFAHLPVVAAGLSPLARGNRFHRLNTCGPERPIPACAGQPTWSRRIATPCWAYPRLRGATCCQG